MAISTSRLLPFAPRKPRLFRGAKGDSCPAAPGVEVQLPPQRTLQLPPQHTLQLPPQPHHRKQTRALNGSPPPNPQTPKSPNPQIPKSPNPQIPKSPNPQIPKSLTLPPSPFRPPPFLTTLSRSSVSHRPPPPCPSPRPSRPWPARPGRPLWRCWRRLLGCGSPCAGPSSDPAKRRRSRRA